MLVMDPDFCILPELTGAQHSPTEPGSPTTTLLHQAFEHAEFAAKYLEIHMRTCKYWNFTDEEIMDSLLVTDQTIHENTPWSYLFDTQRDDDVVIGVLKVLTVFDIQVESLYTDKESQSNLLHPAYKQNREKLIAFLEEAGIDPKVPNKHGLQARDRRKSTSYRLKMATYCHKVQSLVHSLLTPLHILLILLLCICLLMFFFTV